MAELLSHVLLAYALFTAASWRLEWLTRRWIAVGMVGALLPDLDRLAIAVPEHAIESVLSVPFDLDGIHTLGGVIVLSATGAVLFARHRRRAFAILLAGACSHLLVDGLKRYADGAAGVWLYPVTWYRHPTPNLYVSADPLVLVAAATIAAGVWTVDRRIE